MTLVSMTADLRARATRGERLLGTVIASPDPALAEVAAAHHDFLWIDLEHSPLTIRDMQMLCIAARAAGRPALVRVREPATDLLTALLDAGVNGVIAPRVEDPEVAADFAAALRYPPHGRRGVAERRATAYGLGGAGARAPHGVPLCFVQIESGAAVARAEELARVDGVDGLIVGPADLACDLGLPPGLAEPELLDAIAQVRRAAAAAGAICGLAAGGPVEHVLRALGDATLLAYSADVRIYAQALETAALTIGAAWDGRAPLEA